MYLWKATYPDVVTKLSRVVVPWLCYTDQVTELISALLLKDHPEVMISRKALVLFFPVTKSSFCLQKLKLFHFSLSELLVSKVIFSLHLTDRSNQFVSDMLICIIKWKLAFAGVLHFTKRQYPEEWLGKVMTNFKQLWRMKIFLVIWSPEKRFYLREFQASCNQIVW